MPTVSTYPTPAPTSRKVFEEVFISRDIGSTAYAGGSSSPESGLVLLQGSGDIGGNADNFFYTYVETSGDMTFTALIEGFSAADPWAKAGLMVRGALTPQSSHYSMLLTKGSGVANMYRLSSSADSTFLQSWFYAPSAVWLKVTKVGNVLRAYYRPTTSGDSWYQFGASLSVVEIQSNGYYVGIAVASHTNATVATVDVSNIQLSRVCSAASITALQCEQASNCEWGAVSLTCYDKGTKPVWEDGYDYAGSFYASVLDPSSTVVSDSCAAMGSGIAAAVDGSTNYYTCDRSTYLSKTPGIIVAPSHGQLTLVNGIRVYTGNDPNADPTSFQLQGRIVPGSLVREKWDNLCWEVKPSQGDVVIPSACNPSNPLQLFFKTPWSAIHVKGLPGKCLDQRMDTPDANLYFSDCHGGNNQRWSYDALTQRESNFWSTNCIDYNVSSFCCYVMVLLHITVIAVLDKCGDAMSIRHYHDNAILLLLLSILAYFYFLPAPISMLLLT